ncbi:MAG: hypothetical protein LBB61_08265, partial [Treponema sp.]|nr:hypothetical protein [Treponema sp.]
ASGRGAAYMPKSGSTGGAADDGLPHPSWTAGQRRRRHGGIRRRIGGCGQGGEERRLSRLVRSPLLSAARCASR